MTLFEVTQYVCLPIIIGILTLAFPILLQTISRIDEKYNTSVLTQRFKKEKIYIVFQWVLYISLGYVFIHFVLARNWHWTRDCGKWMNEIMPYSSSYFLITCTIILIIKFILLINRIMVYYDHSELLKRTGKKFKRYNDKNTYTLITYGAISNYIFIKNYNSTSEVNIVYEALCGYTKNKYKKEEGFSNTFYDIISILNKTLCQQKHEPVSIHSNNILLNLLLPPTELHTNIIVSEKTYGFLFHALKCQLKYGKVDWVYNYWFQASNYLSSNQNNTQNTKNNSQTASSQNGEIKDNGTLTKPKCKCFKLLKKPQLEEDYDKEIAIKKNDPNDRFRIFHIRLAAEILQERQYHLLRKIEKQLKLESRENSLIPTTFSKICKYYIELEDFKLKTAISFQKYDLSNFYNLLIFREQFVSTKIYLALLTFRLNGSANSSKAENNIWIKPELPNQLVKLHHWQKHMKSLKADIEYWDKNRNHEAFKILEIDAELESKNNPLNKLDKLIKDIEKKIEELEQEGNN